MKRKLVAIPFIIFCLITGCYDVPFTAGEEANAIIVDELIGSWQRNTDEGPTRTKSMVITRPKTSPWYTTHLTQDDDQTREIKFIVHRIGQYLITSSQPQDGTQAGYSIFAITPPAEGSSTLLIRSIDESAPQFKTQDALKKFVESDQVEEWLKRKMVFTRTK